MKIDTECIQILRGVSEGHLSETSCRELRALNQACIQSGLQMVRQKDMDNLDTMLRGYRRLRRTMAGLPKGEREGVYYECGIFNGMYKVFEEINVFFADQERYREVQNILEKKHVPDVLDYLYKHPNSRQGNIARGINIMPNHLSELLNRLLRTGHIERYGKHKDTRYCLTRKGRMDYRSKIQQKKGAVYIEIEYTEIRDKERFFQTRIKEHEISVLKKGNNYGKWKSDFRNGTKITIYR